MLKNSSKIIWLLPTSGNIAVSWMKVASVLVEYRNSAAQQMVVSRSGPSLLLRENWSWLQAGWSSPHSVKPRSQWIRNDHITLILSTCRSTITAWMDFPNFCHWSFLQQMKSSFQRGSSGTWCPISLLQGPKCSKAAESKIKLKRWS